MVVPISTFLFAIACLVTVFFRRAARAERRSAEAEATSVLEKTGLTPQGDVFGAFTLSGLMHGVEIDLKNGTTKLPPGDLEGGVSTCIVSAAAPIPNQIVFQSRKVDQVMGLLPSSPRVRTGHAAFDQAFAVFVVSTSEATDGSYRSSSSTSSIPWAQTSLLERLLELGLLWLRVQEGCVELVFPPLPREEVGRAAALGAAFSLTSHGKPPPTLSVGATAPGATWSDPISSLYTLWGFGTFLGLVLIAALDPEDTSRVDQCGWFFIALSITVIVGSSLVALRRGWTSPR